MASKLEKRQCEPRRGRASWLSAAAAGDRIPLLHWRLGQGCPQATWSYVPRDRLRGVRALEPSLESRVDAPCPPGARLPSLPAFRVAATSALGPGPESQACTPTWREARGPSAQKRDRQEIGRAHV